MAVDRIRTGKTSGRRPRSAEGDPSAYTGVGLLDAEPWLISAWQGAEPGVDDDQSQLPPREYEAYVMTHGCRRYLCLALDWRPL